MSITKTIAAGLTGLLALSGAAAVVAVCEPNVREIASNYIAEHFSSDYKENEKQLNANAIAAETLKGQIADLKEDLKTAADLSEQELSEKQEQLASYEKILENLGYKEGFTKFIFMPNSYSAYFKFTVNGSEDFDFNEHYENGTTVTISYSAALDNSTASYLHVLRINDEIVVFDSDDTATIELNGGILVADIESYANSEEYYDVHVAYPYVYRIFTNNNLPMLENPNYNPDFSWSQEFIQLNVFSYLRISINGNSYSTLPSFIKSGAKLNLVCTDATALENVQIIVGDNIIEKYEDGNFDFTFTVPTGTSPGFTIEFNEITSNV